MSTVAQLAGPMWAVGGQTIEIPAGVDAAGFIIDVLQADGGDLGVRTVEVRAAGQHPFTLVLGADGSVTTTELADPRVLAWLRPARAVNEVPEVDAGAVRAGWTLHGVHPGAGASTWTELLEGTELHEPDGHPGQLLVVARTTLRGVEEAKTLTHRAGAVLMVADAPGRLPADVRRGLTVLSGAAPIVRVPWLPALRGTLTVPHTPAVARAAAETAARVRSSWKEAS